MSDGLNGAYQLDDKGGGHPLDWQQVNARDRRQGALWIHLDLSAPAAQHWLSQQADIDALVVDALTAKAPRSRMLTMGDHLLVILYGANLNPGTDPEDMVVSIRRWLEPERIISVQAQPISAVDDLCRGLSRAAGLGAPASAWFN